MPIKFDILGEKETLKVLDKLDIEIADEAAGEVQDYLLNVMREYPPKRFITRAQAYPNAIITSPRGKRIVGYFSWRQFKFVRALWAKGKVPYKRTQGAAKAWRIVDRGVAGYLVNDSPGAQYLYGDETQANHPRLVGWKTIGHTVRMRIGKIQEIISATVAKVLRKRGV